MNIAKFSCRRAAMLASALLLLSGCGSNPITNLFDGDDENTEGEAPDEEDRISILALEQQLQADPRYAGASIEIPPSYVNSSWTQPGGEADHTLHHLSAPLTFETIWKVDVGDASSRRARLTSPPIVVDNRLFVIDAEAKVSSFDVETGELVWRTELAPEIDERFRLREIFRGPEPAEIGFGGGVAFDQGRLFVTSGFGFVAGLDAQSGEEVWRTQTTAPVRTPPTAYRGRVYLSTNTNEFLALEQETGEQAWSFQSFEESARFLSSSSPAAAGDLVVAPFSSGELVAFLADNGRNVWDTTLSRQTRLTALSELNDIAGSPVIDRGLVYVVSHGGRFSAIDIRSGEPVWESEIASLQMPWVAGDFIYLVSIDSELICVNRNDGAIVWISQLRRYENEKKLKGRIAWAGPVLAGDHLVLVSTEGEIAKVNPQDGEVVSTTEFDDGSVVAPIVAGEKLFILTVEGKLIAMR
ncbi:PQQ-binding-like beta-propeller repeat protein [Hyphococcus sp.]|uniref:PQQ-like beta-propeller repeat protein n=1 Tax=Hyphococcus sp. TaxID=2038636 RepID=UPI003CCBBE60